MKNPWLILLSSAAVLSFGFIINHAPFTIQEAASRWQLDKVLHFFAGYLCIAAAISFLGITNRSGLFFFVLAIGAGWEVLQLFVDVWNFKMNALDFTLDLYDSLGDIAADMLGALGYWLFHLYGR